MADFFTPQGNARGTGLNLAQVADWYIEWLGRDQDGLILRGHTSANIQGGAAFLLQGEDACAFLLRIGEQRLVSALPAFYTEKQQGHLDTLQQEVAVWYRLAREIEQRSQESEG